MRIHIRQCDDQELLLRLDRVCFPDDDRVDPTRGVWWVAYHDDDPVGFAGLYTLVTPICNVNGTDVGSAIFLSRCGIIPMYQGLGLQRRLIRVRLAWGRKNRCKRAITYTAHQNIASARNLQREGFLLYWPETDWSGMQRALYWMRELW